MCGLKSAQLTVGGKLLMVLVSIALYGCDKRNRRDFSKGRYVLAHGFRDLSHHGRAEQLSSHSRSMLEAMYIKVDHRARRPWLAQEWARYNLHSPLPTPLSRGPNHLKHEPAGDIFDSFH